MKVLPFVMSLFALVLAAMAYVSAKQSDSRVLRPVQQAQPPSGTDVEIGDWMRALQLHTSKLWFAGANHNWRLGLFEMEEIDELLEEITRHADLEEGGVRIAGVVEAIRNTEVGQLTAALERHDQERFEGAYDLMLQACNGCHRSSGHEYIRMIRPVRPVFSNQDFVPVRMTNEPKDVSRVPGE